MIYAIFKNKNDGDTKKISTFAYIFVKHNISLR